MEPPRIPPPPPPPRRSRRTAEFGRSREEDAQTQPRQQQQQRSEEETTSPAQEPQELEERSDRPLRREYLLTVKYPRSTGTPPQPIDPPMNTAVATMTTTSRRMDSVQIQVYPEMGADMLAQCVKQAISQFAIDGAQTVLVGLFGEQDRIFHSFEHILSLPEPSRQAYSTVVSPPPRVVHEEPPSRDIPQVVWLGVAFAGLILVYGWIHIGGLPTLVYYIEITTFLLLDRVLGWFSIAHELVVNLPFRELYRHGPHWIGWEGLPLAEVCNRITHFGGHDFWRQNMDQCEGIYAGKEEAFLRTLRPVVYTVSGILLFYIVHSLVVSYGESKRNRTDRAVLDAYHAFQTLVRIANRQVGAHDHHHYDPSRRRH